MATRIEKNFLDRGFGVPVLFESVTLLKTGDEWTLSINYAAVEAALIGAIPDKRARLTGNEVRFIRLHFEMTLTEFGKRFGVSHAAVKKWESQQDGPTKMR